jgi:hypothetical protein
VSSADWPCWCGRNIVWNMARDQSFWITSSEHQIIDISPRIFKLIYSCCVSIIIVICICPPGALIWLINLFLFLFLFINGINNYDWYTTTIYQPKYSRWNINNCGAGTLGQEKRYMHINVHTLTHIYMKGGMRENIYIYIRWFITNLQGSGVKVSFPFLSCLQFSSSFQWRHLLYILFSTL